MDYREQRVRELIMREVSLIIQREVKDPRLPGILTITNAKVSKDLQHATIYFTMIGDELIRKRAKEALDSAANFIRGLLMERVELRYVPRLTFFFDETIDHAARMDEIFKKIEHERSANSRPDNAENNDKINEEEKKPETK